MDCSDVRVSISKECLDKFLFITPEKVPEYFREDLKAKTFMVFSNDSEKDFYHFVWKDIKWSLSNDKDALAVEEFLKALPNEFYRFHNLGEAYGNYEEWGELEDRVAVTHSLGMWELNK